MRLGLFGGSFDPVHSGHLRLAGVCREQAGLDRVWFVPTAVQPHKPTGPVASDADRLEMLELALEGRPGLGVSTIELDRGGVSYTIDTLREVRRREPNAELFLLMGADTLRDLPHWREPAAITGLATPLVVRRPGDPLPDSEISGGLRFDTVDMPATDISSSEIRRRCAAGESIEGLVPEAVERRIHDRRLYRPAP